MGLFNAAFDAADDIITVKEAKNKKEAAKKLALKKDSQKNKDNFAIF